MADQYKFIRTSSIRVSSDDLEKRDVRGSIFRRISGGLV